MSSKFQNDAIFWVEVEKINPNPYQPRHDFNESALRDLAESIRQYGVLQPLTVTRKEETKDDGGLKVSYELIAGERRHRASELAGLSQVPVIIRSGQEDAQVKLELAIIENLQREDLNPIERAEAFDKLAEEFEFTHKKIAEKIGKSREYVSNSMRLLKLPEKIKQAIISGKMTEGHARPIMMLRDNPEEQEVLFKEVVHKGLTVREAESIARRDAQDKVRKKKNKIDPETKALEDRLSDTFGTRVKIEERDVGGKLVIDFFSNEDLENIIKLIQAEGDMEMSDMMEHYVESVQAAEADEVTGDEGDVDNSESKQTENAEREDAGDKTMAETLGTMIAAARQKQNEAELPAAESDSEEKEELSNSQIQDQIKNSQVADEPGPKERRSVSKQAITSKEVDDLDVPEPDKEDLKETPVNQDGADNITKKEVVGKSERFNNSAPDPEGEIEGKTSEPQKELVRESSGDRKEVEDEVETEPDLADFSIDDEVFTAQEENKAGDNSSKAQEADNMDKSQGEDEVFSEEEKLYDEETEEEEPEDIYSVSNFSI